MFASHMVLQRDKPNRFWGWSRPGDTVKLAIAGKTYQGKAAANGTWEIEFMPPSVGGPYQVTVSGREVVDLTDVLVGDVWVCSGQSNMEQGITMTTNAKDEIAAANQPQIRFFLSDHQTGYTPKEVPKGSWQVCTPETIVQRGWGGFSGVGYHFGKKLNQDLGVPIGLVQAAWGGSAAEAWVSADFIQPKEDFAEDLAMIQDRLATGQSEEYQYQAIWLEKYDVGSRPSAGYAQPGLNDTDWVSRSLPLRSKDFGEPNGRSVVWARKKFSVGELNKGTRAIHFGRVVGMESVWINGVRVADFSGDWDRWYEIPDGVLQPFDNTIAIRFLGFNAQDGLLADPNNIYVQLESKQVKIEGPWKVRKSLDLDQPPVPAKNFASWPLMPTVTRNGMIAGLMPLAIRGAIWYQGETNVGRGQQYQKLLPSLIADWRSGFKSGEVPFYIVSLANYEQRKSEPSEDGWAELREAQDLVAHSVPGAGLAVTVDVGDPNDIHPQDKKSVGERLALVALAKEFGKAVPYSGPRYKSHSIEGSSVTISFDHADGLVFRGAPEGFQICGSDRKWVWADAKIVGSTVVVSSSKVKAPVAVRYAWQANPPAPLYNGNGLPAIPFRTDR